MVISAVHSGTAVGIAVERLGRDFGPTRAVDDVTFDVPKGTVVGFIGPNGAGKTTTMRIVATLDLPTRGEAFVCGFSAVTDPERVQRRLGYMPDYYGVYANMNCAEYLDFFARAYGLVGPDRIRRVRRILAFTGVDAIAEKPITSLSKGMRQRLCLGRALIHDPEVLVLDEPAAGLDPRARVELRAMIGELAADGKAILMSSHILTELAEIAEHFVIIEKGQLVQQGTLQAICEAARPKREVEVRLVGPPDELVPWLEGRAGICDVRISGEVVRFAYDGKNEAEDAALLRAIIDAGFAVASFGSAAPSLEDVFMQLTRGTIQ